MCEGGLVVVGLLQGSGGCLLEYIAHNTISRRTKRQYVT